MTAQQNEDLRHVTLECLTIRHPVALQFTAVRRAVAREVPFRFEDDALESALQFLVGKGLLQRSTDDLGSTHFYQATPSGLLAVEREGQSL